MTASVFGAPVRLRAAVLACLALAAVAPPASAAEMKAEQRKAIENVIDDYLLRNPEVIERAIQALEAKREAEKQRAATAALETYRRDLFDAPATPVGGNVRGDVTVVEFFDYRCGVCRRVHPVVAQLTASDKGIRRVYIEWPILGPQSVYAARAALAAVKQGDGKYLRFHDLMMETRGALNKAAVLALAERAGLDRRQLERDIAAPEIDRIIERNHAIARELDLGGTPSFVIGRQVIRGARDLETLRRFVADARAAAKR